MSWTSLIIFLLSYIMTALVLCVQSMSFTRYNLIYYKKLQFLFTHNNLLSIFFSNPEEIIPVRHQETNLMMNKLFQEIYCIFIVLINIDRNHSIFVILMILMFWMIETYVEFLCFLIKKVLISTRFITFLSSTKKWNRLFYQGMIFIMIVDVNEIQLDSFHHFCIIHSLLTVSNIQVHFHEH